MYIYSYEGQKLRASERIYTHAVISRNAYNEIVLRGCCGNLKLAQKLIDRELKDARLGLDQAITALCQIAKNEFMAWDFDSKMNYCQCRKLSLDEMKQYKTMYEDKKERCERTLKTLQIILLERK